MFVLPPRASPERFDEPRTERDLIAIRIRNAAAWRRKRARLRWAVRLGLREARVRLDARPRAYYPSAGSEARKWRWLGRSVRLRI